MTGILSGTLASLLIAGTSRGQHFEREPLRSVTGTVTDHSREPIRGAIVELEMDGAMTVQTYITDERGTYSFRNLRPGADYTIWAKFRDERSKKESISKFDHKADRVIHLVLRPGKE